MENGERLEDTAILLRTNQEAEGLVGALMERQVPFNMKEKLPNLFSIGSAGIFLPICILQQGKRTGSISLNL